MNNKFNKDTLSLITKICDDYWLGLIVNKYIKTHPEESSLKNHLRHEKSADKISAKDFIEIMDNKLSQEDHDLWFGITTRKIMTDNVYNPHAKFMNLLNNIKKNYNIDISEIARINGNVSYYKKFVKNNPENINIENMIYWLQDLDKDFYMYNQNTKKDILFLIDLIPTEKDNKYKEEIIKEILPHLESIYAKEKNPLVLVLIDNIVKKFPEKTSKVLQKEADYNIFSEEESIEYIYKLKLDKNGLRQYVGNNGEKVDIMYNSVIRATEDYIYNKTKTRRTSSGDSITYRSTDENLIKEIKKVSNQFLEYKEMLLSGGNLMTANKNNNDYYHYIKETVKSIEKIIDLENILPDKDKVINKKKL